MKETYVKNWVSAGLKKQLLLIVGVRRRKKEREKLVGL